MEPLFDEYGETYDEAMKKSIGFMGQNHDYYTSAKAACILDVLQRRFGETRKLRVLDVGCGVGKTDRFLTPDLGELTGVDVSPASVERARRENPQVRYESYDGRTLPFAEASFDAAFLICVLHHVVPEERVALLSEASRTLKPGGALLVFEHNPFNPLTRLAVARCAFDRDARLLSRGLSVRLLEESNATVFEKRYILVSPFKFKGVDWIERQFRQAPLGAQYYVGGLKS
jgi:SAM-dependent methyltransferase